MSLGLVIPTIGRTAYLDIAIASALEQNPKFFDIVIFDNSLSGNARSLSLYAENPEIRWLVSSSPLIPMADSWNQAISQSYADFVAILGDDDLLLPNFTSIVYQELDAGHDFLISPFAVIDHAGIPIQEYLWPLTHDRRTLIELRLSRKLEIRVASFIFSKELWRQHPFASPMKNGLFLDDLFLFNSLIKAKSPKAINEKTWLYRQMQYPAWKGIITDYKLYCRDLVEIGKEIRPLLSEVTSISNINLYVFRNILSGYDSNNHSQNRFKRFLENMLDIITLLKYAPFKSKLKIILQMHLIFYRAIRSVKYSCDLPIL